MLNATNSTPRYMISLFCLLLGVYLLSYLNSPNSIDSDALLTVSQNLVQHGTPDMAELGAPENILPEMSRMGTIGIDGKLYSKKGIVPSLFLLPLTQIAQMLPALSVRASGMLFNPIITSLTAVLLYLFVQKQGYSEQVAFIVGLLYGLGTLAFPYTQTLFGEPLAALLILWVLYTGTRYYENQNISQAVLSGLGLGLLAGVNAVYVLLIPFVALYLFGIQFRRWSIKDIAGFMIPLAICGLSLMIFNGWRFDNYLTSGYNFSQGEGFNYPFLWGVFGLTISPYRGIFWYSPILLLAFMGVIKAFNRVYGMALVLTGLQLVLFASWWSWHGGIVWGARFAIPMIPLLMLLVAPAIETAFKQRLQIFMIGALAIVSFGIQLLGVLFNYHTYYQFLYGNYGTDRVEGLVSGLADEVMFNPALSPIIGHVKMLGREPLQLDLFAGGINGLQLVAAIVVIVLGLISFRLSRIRIIPIIFSLIAIIAAFVVAISQSHESVLAAEIDAQLSGDVVVLATTQVGNQLIDVENLRAISTNAPTMPDEPLTLALWQQARKTGDVLWFVTWFSPAHPDNWQELELWSSASFVREIPLDGFRALQFVQSPPAPLTQTGGWVFGEQIALAQYGMRVDADWLLLTLEWEASAPATLDYSFFVHVLDENGAIVAQQDRAPRGAYSMTTQWQIGESIQEQLAFALPDNRSIENWSIRLGWVDWRTGERLPIHHTEDETVAGDMVLLEIE